MSEKAMFLHLFHINMTPYVLSDVKKIGKMRMFQKMVLLLIFGIGG